MITPAFGLTATERVLPKLALDFTTASLDSRITFTRTTGASNPATYVNSSGYVTEATNNQPRFDYDPVTLACKGLLIEESRSNIITYSSDFSNAIWTKTNATVTADFIVSPDGTQNADRVVFSSGSAELTQPYIVTAGTPRTASMYVKGTAGQTILVGHSGGGSTSLLLDGTWQRVTSTDTAGTKIFIGTWGGSTARTVYVWGAQVEAGAFATSYIPTTLIPLTRNADVATMTGTNFSDWFNASAGTVVVALPSLTVKGTTDCVIAEIFNSSANINRRSVFLEASTSSIINRTVNNAGTTVNLTTTSATSTTPAKFAYSWNTSSTTLASAYKGGSLKTSSSGPTPTSLNQLNIGVSRTNAAYLNQHIAGIYFYPQTLTNAEVVAFSKG